MRDPYERGLLESFDCELRCRLGDGPNDLNYVKILKRILRVPAAGLSHEGEPRHAEFVARAFGLEQCGRITTLGSTSIVSRKWLTGFQDTRTMHKTK